MKNKEKKYILVLIIIMCVAAYISGNANKKNNNVQHYPASNTYSFTNDNIITLNDGVAGTYGKYSDEIEGYYYYLPSGKYQIIDYTDNNKNRMFYWF